MYIHIETVTECSESEIRAAFPNTSFPVPFSPPEGYAVLFDSPQPTHDPITQMVRKTTPVLTDKGHWEQAWEVIDLDAEVIAANQAAKVIADREAAKAARAIAVENIRVTTAAGHTYQGDEVSQARMDRAITVLSSGFAPTCPWVLADNTAIQADVAELTEALALAGQAQAALWVI
jgi:hypothetical protein